MTIFAGIDLAWSGHNPSGVCLLRGAGDRLEVVRLADPILRPREVFDLLSRLGPNVIAAIDAPMAWRERCEGERQMGRTFGKFHAAPYTAAAPFLRRHRLTAGPELAGRLSASAWHTRPEWLEAGASGRWAFEVYPHAFHISAFRRDRIIKYKKGTLAARFAGMIEYRAALERWIQHEFPASASALLAALPPFPQPGQRPTAYGLPPTPYPGLGKRLKSVEDQFDAFTCALAAHLAWRDGLHPSELFGDDAEGYIAVPGLHTDPRFAAAALHDIPR